MPGLVTPPAYRRRYDERAHLYEPAPRFPPVSSETSGLQVTDADHATRKRTRCDTVDLQSDAPSFSPLLSNRDFWSNSLGFSRPSVRSPPPLANDRYELAGGEEVTDKFAAHKGDFDDYFQLEKQRGMWSTPGGTYPGGCPQLQVPRTEAKPWMFNQLMTIVGGVAGKLYEFCSVPFRGFQAGGGQAYSFDNQEVAAKLGLHEEPTPVATSFPTHQGVSTDQPENNFGVVSVESLDDERPRVKRQKTAENWVVVGNDGSTTSRCSTPHMAARRASTTHTRSPSQIPRPISRVSMATPAHKRPSLIPVSRRSTVERRSIHGPFKTESRPQSRHGRSYSRQSYGSPVMLAEKKSPLPPESQRLINKMRREEDEEDARMRRMNSQMNAMLREAREALGSKFEIEDEYMDDEGSEDDGHANGMPLFPL